MAKKPSNSTDTGVKKDTTLDDLFNEYLPGAKIRTSDIVGVWDPEISGPIVCIPHHAVVGDGKKFDKAKPSCLIFAELVRPIKVSTSREDSEEKTFVDAQVGELVGIWAKPGMKDIRGLCGVAVVMARDPSKDKDVDKGNDMKGFRVASKATGTMIPLTEDRREKSKGVRCILDPSSYGEKSSPTNGSKALDKLDETDNSDFDPFAAAAT